MPDKKAEAEAEEAPAISEGTPSDGKPNQAEQEPSPAGGDQVAERLHEEQSQGYSGIVADKTPNSEYTVAGVTKTKDK